MADTAMLMGLRGSKSRFVAVTAVCAAMYAAACYATCYIVSPWGMGQFRPAVVIPAVFAVVFGPYPAAIGASIGTLIADSVKHGTLYIPSLTAAVPGNFLGFYMLGKMLEGRFSWRRFIVASSIVLVVANMVVAFLYIATKCALGVLVLPLSGVVAISLGLTVWWYATMLPFMLFVAPPIIKAISVAVPSSVPEDVKEATLSGEDRPLFTLALAVPGVMFTCLGLLLTFTPLSTWVFFGKLASLALEPTKVLLMVSGGGLLALGLGFGLWAKLWAGR